MNTKKHIELFSQAYGVWIGSFRSAVYYDWNDEFIEIEIRNAVELWIIAAWISLDKPWFHNLELKVEASTAIENESIKLFIILNALCIRLKIDLEMNDSIVLSEQCTWEFSINIGIRRMSDWNLIASEFV